MTFVDRSRMAETSQRLRMVVIIDRKDKRSLMRNYDRSVFLNQADQFVYHNHNPYITFSNCTYVPTKTPFLSSNNSHLYTARRLEFRVCGNVAGRCAHISRQSTVDVTNRVIVVDACLRLLPLFCAFVFCAFVNNNTK